MKRNKTPLTKKEAEALKAYTSSGYGAINKLLRKGSVSDTDAMWSELTKKQVYESAHLLKKRALASKIPEDIVTFRAFSRSKEGIAYDIDNGLLPRGSIIKDNGLISTTLDSGRFSPRGPIREFAADPDKSILSVILTPKGTRGIVTSNMQEAEVILAPGTNFRVIDYYSQSTKWAGRWLRRRILFLEVLSGKS